MKLRIIHRLGIWVMYWRDVLEAATVRLNAAYTQEIGRAR